MRSTSLQAYKKLHETRTISNQEYMIMRYLADRKKPVTRLQIEKAIQIGINAVSGRVNLLIKKQLIKEEPSLGKCPVSGSTVTFIKAA